MKKSFKKAVAVLLAVLMVAFSVPFSAFAAVGDYHPNIELQFGTFHGDKATDWRDYTTEPSNVDFSGIFDVPLEYDRKEGTLTLSAAKAAKAAETLGYEVPEEDVTYGVGDYFTVTVMAENIDTVFSLSAYLKYSENIEPAGMYSYQSGRWSKNAIGSISDASAAKGGKMVTGGTSPIASMSAAAFYDINKLGDMLNDYSSIDTERRWIKAADGRASDAPNENYAEINPVYNEYFANPETGELTGYTYESMICETFAFKIVGEGPITFEMADPYNDEIGGFEAGLYIASKAEGLLLCDITTYALTSSLTEAVL